MNINVTTNMGFDNYDLSKNITTNIFQQSSAGNEVAKENANKFIQKQNNMYPDSQLGVLKASTQITLNNSLNETLKYLKSHANSKKKIHIFGELWNIISAENEESEDNPYRGELLNFEIDKNAKNIFAA